MSARDTFDALASLEPEVALPYVEAALTEHYLEIQTAAFEMLADRSRLNRPDVVVHHYETLLPEIRERILAEGTVFVEAARKLIRSGSEFTRRAAFTMLRDMGGPEILRDLAVGLDDASKLIRDNVTHFLEKITMTYHYHLMNWQARKDADSRAYLDRNRAAMLQALEVLLRTWHFHRKNIVLDIAIESGADAYRLITSVVLNHVDSLLWKAFVQRMQAAHSEAMVDILFRLYLEGLSKYRDVAVTIMLLRKDPEFGTAIAQYLWQLTPERAEALAGMKELPFLPMIEANPDLPASAAVILIDFISGASISVKERDTALKSFLRSRTPAVRAYTLRTFRRLNYPHIADLARVALSDPSDDVKLVAARMVAQLQSPQKARLLQPLLNSSREDLCRLALQHTMDLRAFRYGAAFSDQPPPVRMLAESVAERIDEVSVEQVVEEIVRLKPDARLRILHLVEATDVQRELKPAIESILTEHDLTVRPLLVQVLAFTGRRAGLRLLLELMAPEQATVRSQVLETLQDLHDMRFGALFLPFVLDSNPEVAAAAGQVIAAFGQAEAKLHLGRMLGSRDERIRSAAVQAIGMTRIEGGREMLKARMAAEASHAARAVIHEVLERWS
ncbi:MAG: HEAT repeat domain-containing protein [Planctomycetes bacterium]|nr:HEAT repeat domain-containing protein [Planctomycetota bacterium]